MSERIFLFDLDGVLIQPGGYRAAVRASLDYFASRLGAGPQDLAEETISIFEAQGITSEWDMVPISLAILLEGIAAREGRFSGWDSLEGAVNELSTRPPAPVSVDYAATIRKLPAYLQPPAAPSDAILANITRAGAGELFPHLSGSAILQDLFGRTRDLRRCATSTVFQNFILGDRLFSETYGVPAKFAVDSYLAQYDQVVVAPDWRARLLRENRAGALKIAAITARPSMPPVRLGDAGSGYSPEAEQALELAGLSGIAFMGYGSILYLAGLLGQSAELLLKPSPVQALAALLAALGEPAWPALLEAAQLAGVSWPQGQARPVELSRNHFRPGASFAIHIFEDSPIGIQATQAAAQILRKLDVDVRLSAWGITQNPDKRAALERLGARVFPDVNQALDVAFSE